jgi:hypothetical protein
MDKGPAEEELGRKKDTYIYIYIDEKREDISYAV